MLVAHFLLNNFALNRMVTICLIKYLYHHAQDLQSRQPTSVPHVNFSARYKSKEAPAKEPQAADKVQPCFMIVRAIDGSSAALIYCKLEFKDKSKTVGVARQQLHFLCSDKENEAKESLALRLALLARKGGSINSGSSSRLKGYTSLAGSEALESLSFCGVLNILLQSCFYAFPL